MDFNKENGHERIPTCIAYTSMTSIPLVQVILIILKCCSVLDWPWYLVFIPMIVTASVMLLASIVFLFAGIIR